MTDLEAIEWHEEFIAAIEREGCTNDESYQAAKVALAALREKQAAQQNDPLTLEELRGMDGEPVYISGLDVWVLVNMDAGLPDFVFSDGGKVPASDCYEADYIAYRRPPEE